MSVYRGLWRVLATVVLSLAIQDISAAGSASSGAGARSPNSVRKSAAKKGAEESCLPKNESSSSLDEEGYFPFKKSASDTVADNVAGVRIESDKVVLLGYDKAYSVKALTKEEDFSDMNFFRKYPKLLSIELNDVVLTSEKLENIQKFAPQNLKSIIIRRCHIQNDEDYKLVADFLEKHDGLESVTIVQPELSGEPLEEVLSALKGNKKIKFLNATVLEISNEGGEKLAELISESAGNLCGISLGWYKATGKEEEVYEKISEALGKAKKLETLELAFLSSPEGAFGSLSESIGNLSKLQRLAVFFGGLDSHDHVKVFEQAESFQKSLESLSELEILDISSNAFSKEVTQLILASVQKMKKLKTLNISGNVIDDKSASTLSESIGEYLTITTLIANNCSINDAILGAMFSKSGKIPPIRYLSLKDNEIKDGVKSLPIDNMNDLVSIDFFGNRIDYEGVMAFVDNVAGHTCLKIANFRNNSGIDSTSDIEKSRWRDELEKKRIEKKVTVALFGV
ncbi:MAG: hypothetical protein LBB21_00815 [Holosporaceae bacterium]|jgi:Ran GTPase-activating protein (RanGAP) involved in mRNA processing and transport|nr:hypothetical protein [Holosporaceae bacterium]